MTKKNITATLRRIGAVGLAAATVAAGLSLGPAAHAAAAAPDASGPASLIGKLITINYGGAEGTRDKYWSPQAPQIGKWVTGPTTSYISDARAAAVEWQIPAVGSTGPIRGTGSASGVCIVGLASPGNIMAAACNGSPFQDFSWFDVSNTYGTGLGLSPVVAGASYLSFGTIIGNGIFQTMSGADSVVLDEFEAVFRAAVTSIDVARRTATVGGSAAPHATIRVDGTQQVSADGAGVWSATVSGLSLGMNQVALEHWENGVRTADATVDVDLAVQPVTASATFPDDPTRDAVLAGTAHPGATVVVQDAAGAELDRAPVGTDGAWTADIPAPNAGGDYPVTVHQEIDGEANGEITETIAYGAAVTVTRPVPDEAHDGGPVSMRGTGEAGARIDVREEGRTTIIGTETVLVDGTWNLTTTDVDDREHTLVATQTGKGRNVTTQTITLNPDADGVAQPFALTDPKDGDTVVAPDNQVTFTGVGTTGDTVVITNTFNGRVVATTTIDDAGTWSRTGSVGFGVQDLRATVTHGGVATGHPLTITVNATAGVVGPFAISTPADGSTVVAPDNRVTFTGTGTTGARVVLTAGTGRQVVNTVVDGHGNWSATGYLSHQWYELDTTYTVPGSAPVTGKTTVTVVETDAVIAPFGITSPADGSTVVAPTNMVTFTGTGAAGATVELINDLGGPWERVVARATVQNDGTWTATGGLGFQTYPLAYVHTPGDLGGTPATGTTIVTVVAR